MNAGMPPVSGSALCRPTESILGIGYSLLCRAEQTGGRYELMQFVVSPGHGPPLHCHRHEDECFYVADGRLEIRVGDETIDAATGTYAHLPRGVPHAFRNTGERIACFLCWVLPGNLAGFFDAFKRPWPADKSEPPSVNDEDVRRMMKAAASYDVEILG